MEKATQEDADYEQWLTEMVAALPCPSRERVAALHCVRKALRAS